MKQAAERELLRKRQHGDLLSTAGAWKDKDHPELKDGSAQWVRKLRQESEVRFQKIQRRRVR